MMRSLWTGASGMIAQQTNVDTIANNLSNVNTSGYKSERQSLNHCSIKPFRPKQRLRTGKRNRSPHRWGLVQEWRLTLPSLHRAL